MAASAGQGGQQPVRSTFVSDETVISILELISDAFSVVDREWRYLYLNQRAAELLGVSRHEVLGRNVWELFPETVGSAGHRELVRAMDEGLPVVYEEHYPSFDAWLGVHAYPTPDGLAIFFQDITARKRAEAEMLSLNAELEQRVAERTASLEAANRELAKASQMKSEFLASMSHELRTPLNAIIGFAEVLLDPELNEMPDEQRTQFLKNIRRSGRHLLGLINDILDLSKVEAGRLELHPETVMVNELIMGCVAIVRPLADKKHVTIQSTCEPPDGLLHLDVARFKQILYNLLSNAVKFTPEGGHVAISTQIGQSEACIAVRDTGIGIRPEDQTLIFEEFRQVDQGPARQQEGTGLGLALVRRLVDLHGGHIWVDSAPGKGSTFTFTIPVTGGTGEAAGPIKSTVGSTAETATEYPESKGLSVLVVEDDREAAELLTLYLTRAGYAVHRASSAAEALEATRRIKPFAVTLDVLLPGSDGWEILAALKSDPLTRDVAVIVVSVLDNRELGFALGATDCLVKPIDKDALLAALKRLDGGTSGFSQPSVLVIDDDPMDLNLLETMLRGSHCRVLLADSGIQGVRLAKSEHPDLIVLDLLMPGMSGFEVVHDLRQSAETAGLPIVICTAKDLTADERRELNGQVQAIVTKGSEMNDLLHELLRLEPIYARFAASEGAANAE